MRSNRYGVQETETLCFFHRSSGTFFSPPGIPKLLTDVVKTSETNLFRSITEGKVSDTRTSDQTWLSYSSTQELRDLHNFTVQVRSIGVMATRPVLFDPCPYVLLMVWVCSSYKYCIHMSCIHYRHGMPSPIDSGHMSTSQVLRIPESYFEEKSLGSTCETLKYCENTHWELLIHSA